VKKKIWANLQRIIELSKKLSLSSQNNGFGIRDLEKPIPDPRSRGQYSTGSRIWIRNTGRKWCGQAERSNAETGISKNYCATNTGLPKVELRFCPWIILFKY
jgi:hypothetical protein